MSRARTAFLAVGATAVLLCLASAARAHGVAADDESYIRSMNGPHFWLFLYLGAKHMVTGIDHLLFLTGVIFFLHRIRNVALYVTLFAAGHSLTLILGVLLGIDVNPWLVDAIIGLSVVYKALENVNGLERFFGLSMDTRIAVLAFGLVHGLGLATKVQQLGLSEDGLVVNLVAFNVGVEIGQLLALAAILVAMGYWRRTASFARHAFTANMALMAAGFVLIGMHLTGYFVGVTSS